jgi:hypothetical protein
MYPIRRYPNNGALAPGQLEIFQGEIRHYTIFSMPAFVHLDEVSIEDYIVIELVPTSYSPKKWPRYVLQWVEKEPIEDQASYIDN